MLSDRWPSIKVRRFDHEPEDEYRLRRNEIVAIIDGFRHGRFAGELADQLDERLEGLQSGIVDARTPSPLTTVVSRPAACRPNVLSRSGPSSSAGSAGAAAVAPPFHRALLTPAMPRA